MQLLVSMTHVVGGPPGLEHEVALQLLADAALELGHQLLHVSVLLVVHQRPHRAQVLSGTTTQLH